MVICLLPLTCVVGTKYRFQCVIHICNSFHTSAWTIKDSWYWVQTLKVATRRSRLLPQQSREKSIKTFWWWTVVISYYSSETGTRRCGIKLLFFLLRYQKLNCFFLKAILPKVICGTMAEEPSSDQKLYCFSWKGEFGKMISCVSPYCNFIWFHYTCLHLDPEFEPEE